MALNDDIDDIKMKLEVLRLSQQGVSDAIVQMADKVDIIVSSRIEPCPRKEDLFKELSHLFRLLEGGDKTGAAVIIRRLTGCVAFEAQKMVENIDVADDD